MLHNFLNHLKQAITGLSEPLDPVPLTKLPQASLDSQDGFSWEPSSPAPSNSHLRLLYSSHRVAPSKTQVEADLGLHRPGNPRACASSGQLQAMLEHHHPAPAQLLLHRGQRLVVVSGHSQSLQLTGLGKPLPLTCQQQSSLNYKSGVYSSYEGCT